jgi:hypothetical protein
VLGVPLFERKASGTETESTAGKGAWGDYDGFETLVYSSSANNLRNCSPAPGPWGISQENAEKGAK